MSFSRRLFLLLIVPAALAACGFSPVYGPNGAASGLRGSILVDAPDNRNEFVFVAQLEERLGQPQSAQYELSYRITTTGEGVGITPAQETTRFNILGRVDYTLKEAGTDTVVHEGKAETFTGYSATGSIVGTLSATRDANERLMVALADQIVTRLIASAPDWQR